MYDLIYRGGWTLLGFAGRGRRADPAATRTAVEALSSRAHSYAVHTIADHPVRGRAAAVQHGYDDLWDLDEEAHRVYGISTPTLVLVRPDGHIAVRAPIDKSKVLGEYFARWSVNREQQFFPLDQRDGQEEVS